jgi:hypothetical protein
MPDADREPTTDGPLELVVLQNTKYYGVLCILLFHAVLAVSTMSVLLRIHANFASAAGAQTHQC